MPVVLRGLYVIVDPNVAAGRDIVKIAQEAIAGGARYADVPSLGDAALEQVARDHLRRALSIDAGAPLGITRWPLAVPQPLPGHGARIDALERLLPGRVLFAGAWYRGVSVLDCLRQGLRTADALAR